MSLENFRELTKSGPGVNAGFQFEFYCAHCKTVWKSPFKPYRSGQLAALVTRYSFLLGPLKNYRRDVLDAVNFGSRSARDGALADAQAKAAEMFRVCPGCDKAACANCLGENDRECVDCRKASAKQQAQTAEEASRRAAQGCPNCGTARDGGRFCPECGFGMASTHKSCPACSAQMPRKAHYCTDCGHAF